MKRSTTWIVLYGQSSEQFIKYSLSWSHLLQWPLCFIMMVEIAIVLLLLTYWVLVKQKHSSEMLIYFASLFYVMIWSKQTFLIASNARAIQRSQLCSSTCAKFPEIFVIILKGERPHAYQSPIRPMPNCYILQFVVRLLLLDTTKVYS